jgi:DNA-binding NarL/FixJ family response regulator
MAHGEIASVPVPIHGKALRPSQVRVLKLVADGYSDREIARTLGVSVDNVKRELRGAALALSTRNRTDTAVAAVRLRLL